MTYVLLGADRRSYESDVKGQWGGHRRLRIYGRLDCPSARRAIARGGYVRHRVFFADEATAIAAGYRPCAVCCTRRYRVWQACKTPSLIRQLPPSVVAPARPARLSAPTSAAETRSSVRHAGKRYRGQKSAENRRKMSAITRPAGMGGQDWGLLALRRQV